MGVLYMGGTNESKYHTVSYFADGTVPALMTESEVIEFLRIPEITSAKDHHKVIKNLIRFRDLPRIHICKRTLFPKKAVLEWINNETIRKGP
jgi:hypothetical protein